MYNFISTNTEKYIQAKQCTELKYLASNVRQQNSVTMQIYYSNSIDCLRFNSRLLGQQVDTLLSKNKVLHVL